MNENIQIYFELKLSIIRELCIEFQWQKINVKTIFRKWGEK